MKIPTDNWATGRRIKTKKFEYQNDIFTPDISTTIMKGHTCIQTVELDLLKIER